MFSCMQKSKFGMITVCANKDKLRKLIFLIIFSLTRNHREKHEKTTAFNKNNKQKYSVSLSFFFSFFFLHLSSFFILYLDFFFIKLQSLFHKSECNQASDKINKNYRTKTGQKPKQVT